jgi:hypothetical protein
MQKLGSLTLAAAAVSACNLISGVDDYQFGAGGSATTTVTGSTTGGSPTSTGSMTTSSSSGSGMGGCGPDTKICGDICASLDDPAYGCGLAACDPCGAGEDCCGSPTMCTSVVGTPTHCGDCNTVCNDSEWCIGTSCDCRPGLVMSGSDCVDPLSDPSLCGSDGPCQGATPLCQNGQCVSACSGGFQECDGGCVDQSTDPLNCGECGHSCNSSQVCGGNDCVSFHFGEGCSSCPCSDCSGDYDLCCMAGSTPICVKDAAVCP